MSEDIISCVSSSPQNMRSGSMYCLLAYNTGLFLLANFFIFPNRISYL